MGKNIKMNNGPIRKRGRPSGKNRTPLSLEERRARNAQYERERRAENAEAMADLAEAMGIDATEVQSEQLIDAVIRYIQQDRESVESLKALNRKLKTQIKSCEDRLKSAAPEQQQFSPETPSPQSNDNFSMAATNYMSHASQSLQFSEERLMQPAPGREKFLPETPSPEPNVDFPMMAMNYTQASTSVQSSDDRPNPAPTNEEFWPETPSPVLSNMQVPSAALNILNGLTPHLYPAPLLTPGAVPSDTETYGYSSNGNMELSPPNTQEHIQSDDVELDFEFLLQYLD